MDPDYLEGKVAWLDEQVDNLERRVKELEDAIKKQVPWTWPNVEILGDNEPRCGTCYITFKNMMHYCCQRTDCPSATRY